VVFFKCPRWMIARLICETVFQALEPVGFMENFGVFVHVHNMGPYAVEILLKHSMDIGP